MTSQSLSDERTEEFVSLLTSAQDALYRYVLTLMAGQHDRARDLLQETNLVVWRKASEFRWGTDFGAWARRIAYFCVLSDQRDAQRSPISFGGELIQTLAEDHDKSAQDTEKRRSRLEECLVKLPKAQRAAIRLRYVDGLSVAEIAEHLGKSSNTTSAFLYRIRLALLHCVGRKAV